MDNRIGIFDSGFGGLTVMRAIRKLLPQENIIYFGDTARLPYGNKSPETILRYSLENSAFLVDQGIKILVIACHTACSVAFETLRDTLPIPVVSIIETGVDEIAHISNSNNMVIIGTRATITSGVYQQRLKLRSPQAEITAIACPFFVPLVEEGYLDHPITELTVQEYLRPLQHKQIHAVLLGCTHYPLLQTVIQKELGPHVTLVDPAAACAKQIQKILQDNNLENRQSSKPHYQFFVSDDPEKFRLLGQSFLNHPIEDVLMKNK